MTPVGLGLDLSFTALGMVAGPADWDLDWNRLRTATLGVSLPATATTAGKLLRMRALAVDVARFADRNNVTHVWIEGLPKGRNIYGMEELAELRGVVRIRVYEQLGIAAEIAPQTSIRKTLLGYEPAKDKKAHVQRLLQSIPYACVLRDEGQRDAFAVWNYGVSELGAPCISMPAPERQSKTKRGRKAA